MASDMAVEDAVMEDFQQLLEAAGLTTHKEGEHLDGADYSAGRVAVNAEVSGSSLDQGGGLPAGFPRLTVTLVAQSYLPDDKDRSALKTITRTIRETVEYDEIKDNLTAADSPATYYHLQIGPSYNDDQGKLAQRVLTYDVVIRPSND